MTVNSIEYFSNLASAYDLVALRCPTRPDRLSGLSPVRGDGWRWDPDQPVGPEDWRWTGEWKWTTPTPGTTEIELISDQTLTVVGVMSLNGPGEYAIEVGSRKMIAASDEANDEAWPKEFFRHLRPGPPTMQLAGEIDVSLLNNGPGTICPINWGISSPMVPRGIVIRVRVIDPSADLHLCVFGEQIRAQRGKPLDSDGSYPCGGEG